MNSSKPILILGKGITGQSFRKYFFKKKVPFFTFDTRVKKEEFKLVGELITKVIKGLSENPKNNTKVEKEVQKEVVDLCSEFPIYSE